MTPLIERLRSTGMLASLIRGSAAAFVFFALGQAIRYVGQVLLARWLGVTEYGAYMHAFSWAQYLAVIGALGFDLAVLRYVPAYLAQQEWGLLRGFIRRSRWIVGAAGAALGTAVALVVLIAQPARINTQALALSFTLVPLLALVALQVGMARGAQKIAAAYLPALVARPLLLIGGAYLLLITLGRLDAATAIIATIAAYGLVVVLQAVSLRRVLPTEIFESTPRSQGWVRMTLPMLFTSGASAALELIDVILVGLMLGERQAGIYSAAAMTASLLNFALAGTGAIAVPMIADLHTRQDRAGLQHLMRWLTLILGGAALGMGLPILLLAPWILRLFGAGFESAYWPLVLWTVARMVNTAAGPNLSMLNVTGLQTHSARLMAFTAVLNVLLLVLLIPALGILGAAAAGAAAWIGWNAGASYLIYRHLGIRSFIFLLVPAQSEA